MFYDKMNEALGLSGSGFTHFPNRPRLPLSADEANTKFLEVSEHDVVDRDLAIEEDIVVAIRGCQLRPLRSYSSVLVMST
jgi:hypothetical protein